MVTFTAQAPPDLLAHRDRVMALTGLRGSAIGIAGDQAHTSGYHRSLQDLFRVGTFHPAWAAGDRREDFSARLARDRLAWGVSGPFASAVDYGDDWPIGGRAAWLRFNALLAGAFAAGDSTLAAVRAVNYSTRGTADTRYRLDREHGFRREPNTDSTAIHTHVEWYRDTFGDPRRAISCGRIEGLIRAAIGMETDDVSLDGTQANQLANTEAMLGAIRDLSPTVSLNPLDPAHPGPREFTNKLASVLDGMSAGIITIAGRLPAQPVTIDPVAFADSLSDAQLEAIGRGVGAAFAARLGGSSTG